MQKSLLIFFVLCAAAATCVQATLTMPTARLWSVPLGTNAPGITYGVRQVVADGSGGCAIIYTKDDGANVYYYVARFDKKGVLVPGVTFSELADIAIVYCDKKVIDVSYRTSGGISSIMTLYVKRPFTGAGAAGANIYADVNGNGEAGGPGDKKGYFAVRFTTATGEYRLERYLHKAQK
ncbi:MAG: hypothetical protein NTV22_12270 [bacterium]|nr:hypothetical protein [bacterium]